jgi:hypothetical protein
MKKVGTIIIITITIIISGLDSEYEKKHEIFGF